MRELSIAKYVTFTPNETYGYTIAFPPGDGTQFLISNMELDYKHDKLYDDYYDYMRGHTPMRVPYGIKAALRLDLVQLPGGLPKEKPALPAPAMSVEDLSEHWRSQADASPHGDVLRRCAQQLSDSLWG